MTVIVVAVQHKSEAIAVGEPFTGIGGCGRNGKAEMARKVMNTTAKI